MPRGRLEKIQDSIAGRAAVAGLDLWAPLPVAVYNRSVPEPYALPTFGRERPAGIVLGNSRALWPRFLDALKASETLRESAHPLNEYVTSRIGGLVESLSVASEVRWAHASEPGPVAMQRAALISGLAHTSPSYLSIHPEHGPWIGLRAVIVLDLDWKAGIPDPAPDPCTPCEKPCMPALEAAVETSKNNPTGRKVAGSWRLWLAVRDACPVGRPSRYSDEQCEYHYRPDPGYLLRMVRGW